KLATDQAPTVPGEGLAARTAPEWPRSSDVRPRPRPGITSLCGMSSACWGEVDTGSLIKPIKEHALLKEMELTADDQVMAGSAAVPTIAMDRWEDRNLRHPT